MRKYLIALAALFSIGTAQAELVNNPGLFPSASLIAGDCMQATGPNSVASTGAPCGSGGGGGSGNVNGPTSSTVGNIAVWTNGTGTGIGDSGVAAASIPFLGSNNVWGGANTFELPPVIGGTGGGPVWYPGNFDPSLYLTAYFAEAGHAFRVKVDSCFARSWTAGA